MSILTLRYDDYKSVNIDPGSLIIYSQFRTSRLIVIRLYKKNVELENMALIALAAKKILPLPYRYHSTAHNRRRRNSPLHWNTMCSKPDKDQPGIMSTFC